VLAWQKERNFLLDNHINKEEMIMLKKINFLALIAAFGFLGLQGAQAMEDLEGWKRCRDKAVQKDEDCQAKALALRGEAQQTAFNKCEDELMEDLEACKKAFKK
jgi:hypothetical protein